MSNSNNTLVHFELNTAGVRELLQSSGAASVCEDIAEARCPLGCVVNTVVGKNRVNVRIVAETDEAIKDNLNNNTLLGAIS